MNSLVALRAGENYFYSRDDKTRHFCQVCVAGTMTLSVPAEFCPLPVPSECRWPLNVTPHSHKLSVSRQGRSPRRKGIAISLTYSISNYRVPFKKRSSLDFNEPVLSAGELGLRCLWNPESVIITRVEISKHTPFRHRGLILATCVILEQHLRKERQQYFYLKHRCFHLACSHFSFVSGYYLSCGMGKGLIIRGPCTCWELTMQLTRIHLNSVSRLTSK